MVNLMDRNAIVDAVVALFQNSTKTKLATISSDDIQYLEKDPRQIQHQVSNIEIWVAPASDRVPAITLAKESHQLTIYVTVFAKGEYGITDKRTAVEIIEECEQEILENRTLSGGVGIVRGPIEMDFVSFFGEDFTGNYAFMQFPVDKTTIVT